MSTVTASIFPRVEEDRYVALLQAANAIATCSDCDATSEALVSKLREVTHFDFLHLVAFDKDTNQVCFSLLDANGRRLEPPADDVLPLADSPIQHAHDSGEAVVTLDWSLEPRFQSYGKLSEPIWDWRHLQLAVKARIAQAGRFEFGTMLSKRLR